MKKRVQEMRQIAKNTERVRFLEKIEERKEKAKSVSLRLNPVFLKKLKYLSDKYNLSQSAIVEIAIEEMENKLETII